MNFGSAVAARQRFGALPRCFVISLPYYRTIEGPRPFHSFPSALSKEDSSAIAPSSGNDATEGSTPSAANLHKAISVRRYISRAVSRGAKSDGAQISVKKGAQQSRVKLPSDQKALVPEEASDAANVEEFKFPAAWLRDTCTCDRCVDPSSQQKLFQTSDIPVNLKVSKEVADSDGNLSITWENDLPGFGADHISHYSSKFLSAYSENDVVLQDGSGPRYPEVKWNKAIISQAVKFLDYNEYMNLDRVLYEALDQLNIYGMVFIRGVPDNSAAVELIGGRIGNLRDTFYGRTWDVKSVPNAKNIAYTSQPLGFHMDLLYMGNPPGFQLLHCLANTCEGGSSIFSDSFNAVTRLEMEDRKLVDHLSRHRAVFHYKNAGHHYRFARKVVEMRSLAASATERGVRSVNWSPPFQAPFGTSTARHFPIYLDALRALGRHIEAPENIYDYRLKEGECVIFNNRRVLHARRAFDVNSGERWLKGAYVDTDVFRSRYRVLRESLASS